MITDTIVLLSVAFAIAFSAAWLLSPTLRSWVERPKHRFRDDVRGYDRAQQAQARGRGDGTP